MALLEIKKYPEKILKEKTAPVVDINSSIQRLIDDMIETMYAAKGVGLAANQVGVSKRLCVIDVSAADEKTPLIVLINPEIVEKKGSVEDEEGCLSIHEYRAKVKRAEEVLVKGLDRKGKPIEIAGGDLLARALQHEIDHLDGLLFIDRLSPIKREFFKKRYKKILSEKSKKS
ncbi:MAG: peptide deformylase [Nitrospirae bacterium]|nr:peptide deformylase [Nitrospirota bacterium]